MGLLDPFFSGRNREIERKTRQAQDRENERQVNEFNGIQELQTKYAKESLRIKIENDETIRDRQNKLLWDQRNFAEEQRQYEFDQAMRVFDLQTQRYTEQKSFNEIAYDQAMRQQSQYLQETLRGMEFDATETFLNFTAASAGLDLKKAGAKADAAIRLAGLADTSYQALDVAKTKTAFSKRQANIEALKASGQLSARGGAGVSVGKAKQGIKAELGASKAQMSKQLLQEQRKVAADMFFNQRAIVNQLLTTEADVDIQLGKLNYQLDLDQAKISISRDNLRANDKLIRDRIALQRRQADLNNIQPLRPEETPEIPMVRELPMMQYQEVFEPPKREFKGPLPKGPEAYGPDWGAMANSALTIAASVATAGAGAGAGGTFHWGKGLLGGLGAASGVKGLPNIIQGGGDTIGSDSLLNNTDFLNILNTTPSVDYSGLNTFADFGQAINFGQALNLGQINKPSSYNPLF